MTIQFSSLFTASLLTFSAVTNVAHASSLTSQDIISTLGEVKTTIVTSAKQSTEELFQLGKQFQHGDGVEQNTKEAMHYYRLAANKGHAQAQHNLGTMLAEQNEDSQALRWLNMAYTNGAKKSAFEMARIQQKHARHAKPNAPLDQKPRDTKEIIHDQAAERALHWFNVAAKQGDDRALLYLADWYAEGEFTKQDADRAYDYYQQAIAQGSLQAQFILGARQISLGGVPLDIEAGRNNLTEAADAGYVDAQSYLGTKYLTGSVFPPDAKLADHYLSLAAKANDQNAAYNLAMMYQNGDLIEPNWPKSAELLEQAALLGMVKAQYMLAYAYEFDRTNLKSNAVKSLKWYETAAQQGDSDAMYRLGVLNEIGKFVEQNQTRAFDWYSQAAEAGHEEAYSEIAYRYLVGLGTDSNYYRGNLWASKSAALEDGFAQYLLAEIYAHGMDTEKDLIRAYAWAQAALSNDYQKAKEIHDSLMEQLSYEQLQQARLWYAVCKSNNYMDCVTGLSSAKLRQPSWALQIMQAAKLNVAQDFELTAEELAQAQTNPESISGLQFPQPYSYAKNYIIGWVPESLANTPEEARLLVSTTVTKAMVKSLKRDGTPAFASAQSKLEKVAGSEYLYSDVLIEEQDIGCPNYTQAGQDLDKTCYLTSSIKLPQGPLEKMPAVTGMTQMGYPFSAQDLHFVSDLDIYLSKQTELQTYEILKSISQHLPAWLFIYVSSEMRRGTSKSMPYLLHKGELKLFISPN